MNFWALRVLHQTLEWLFDTMFGSSPEIPSSLSNVKLNTSIVVSIVGAGKLNAESKTTWLGKAAEL